MSGALLDMVLSASLDHARDISAVTEAEDDQQISTKGLVWLFFQWTLR